MMASVPITQMLSQWARGDSSAGEQLFLTVYEELRRIARRQLRREDPSHTLQPTALVHETYLQLVKQTRPQWENRAHFFGLAACLMRRTLLKQAERRAAAKRSAHCKAPLEEAEIPGPDHAPAGLDRIALKHALKRLSDRDPRQGVIVELLFFGGLNIDEVAGALGLSTATVKREWRMARAWLCRALAAPDRRNEKHPRPRTVGSNDRD